MMLMKMGGGGDNSAAAEEQVLFANLFPRQRVSWLLILVEEARLFRYALTTRFVIERSGYLKSISPRNSAIEIVWSAHICSSKVVCCGSSSISRPRTLSTLMSSVVYSANQRWAESHPTLKAGGGRQ